ncbi:hypothetical protein ACTMQO_08345 [Escherichia coli]
MKLGMSRLVFKDKQLNNQLTPHSGDRFKILPEGYFSVGQDVDYYQRISNLPESIKVSLLEALKDIAYTPELIDFVKNEAVFKTSLLGSVSLY